MVLARGLRPLQVVSAILVVRLLSVFLVQTWFVPDEYWQTLEVAHKQAFGYGVLTWEWQKGIRSYLYPSVIGFFYTVLSYTGLDYPDVLILLPRILQALVSTAADYSFYKWTGGRKWALFLCLTSWFWFYTSGRTLLQTLETAFVAIALSQFPFKSGKLSYYEKENDLWILLACISTFVRPTSAPLWVVLGVYNLATTNQPRIKKLLTAYLPTVLLSGLALVGLDSYFHGSFIITPWEFVKYNVVNDISSFYGVHPWHWYLTQGLPAVLGVSAAPVLAAAAAILRRPREHVVGAVLLAAACVSVAVHSFIPHKELRFMLPLLPIFLYLAQDVIVPWSRKANKWALYGVALVLLVGNAAPALYFGLVHQRAALLAMPLVRDNIHNKSSVLFLMPCHSTPLYSHIHANITTRYLRCEPGTGPTEAEQFLTNPQRWWRGEYSARQTPDLVLLFDKLRGRVADLLEPYSLLHELEHTQFPEGEVGKKILLYKKKLSQPKQQTDEVD